MTRRREPIYVESVIRAPVETIWDATQDPELATTSGRPSGLTPLRRPPDRQPDVGELP